VAYGGIRRDKYDATFSDLIRERADWTCERCGLVDPDGQARGKSRRVENSHFNPRRHQSTRFCGENCDCLCKKCHQHFTEDNTGEYAEWKRGKLGDERYEALLQKGRQVKKRTKAEKEEMLEHYLACFGYIRKRREKGQIGYIEFPAWD